MNTQPPTPPRPSTQQGALSRRQLLSQSLKLGGSLGLGAGTALSLAGCGGGGGTGTAPAMPADEAARRLPALAAQMHEASRIPGLAWAVVQGEQRIAAQGLGVREAGRGDVVDAGNAVDADTCFQLASVSKSLGALVVARQVGEGRVRWDSRMQELLPWFALSNPESTARLTVADLYSHRSGLPDHAGDLLEEMGYGQRELFERLRLVPVEPLRTDYAYTNAGLTAAAVGVAQAAGTDWATLSRQTLYAPLGMERTTSSHAQFMQQSNRATGHVRVPGGGWVPGPPRNADVQSAAGGASSSVNDMARWMSLVLGRGLWRGQRLVAASALEPVLQPQSNQGKYGYGFNVGATEAGLPFFSHSGAFLLGAATSFMLVPSFNAGIVVLTNAAPVGVAEALCRQFVDLMENGRLTQDWWVGYQEKIAPLYQPTGTLVDQPPPAAPESPGPLAAYTGTYDSGYYGPLRVDLVQGALQLTLGPAPQVHTLRHWNGRQFFFLPEQESAAPGTISLAEFAPPDPGAALPASVRLEFYDAQGLGRFTRRA